MLLAELRFLLRRARIRVLLVVLAAIPVLLSLAVYFGGGPTAGNGPTFLDQVTHNGVFVALAALTVCISFFLPLTVSVVAGDTIAGEASLGTLRYLLVRPCGRARLLGAKAMGVGAFAIVAAVAIAVGGLIAGAILFPLGPVVGLSGNSMSLAGGIGRVLLAAVVVGLSMFGVGAIGVFVSTLTSAPIAAMAVTMGLVVASLVMDSVSQLSFLHPWLFSHQWLSFGDLLRSPVTWHNIVMDLVLQAGYTAVFLAAAWARFTTKDVTS